MAPRTEDGKQIVRRWVKEVFNEHRLDSVEHLKVAEYTDWNPYPGQDGALQGFKTVLTRFFEAFPDFHYDVHEELEEGDTVVCIGTWSGTHLNPLMGMPATGQKLSGRRIDIVRFVDDKMTERWGTGNELKMMQLLGMSAPAGAAASIEPVEVARRFVQDALNRSDLTAVEHLVDAAATQNARGTVELLLLIAGLGGAGVTIDEIEPEAGGARARLTITGKKDDGEPVTASGKLTLRVDGGKIVDSRWEPERSADAAVAASQPGTNGAPDRKTIARRFVEEVLNQRRADAAADLLADGAVDQLPESLTALAVLRAFPDYRIQVDHVIEEDDRVVTLGTLRGTQTGPFLGQPATGRGVDVRNINVFTITGGRIVDCLFNFDLITLTSQLALFPAMAVNADGA